MNLHKMFQTSFSAVSPLKSNDELLKSVMERTEKMEKKRSFNVKKAVIAVCTAVIAVTAATITVGAVNGWNYAEVFQSLFGEKTENIMENIVPEAVVLEDTIDNMDFEITAAAADKHSILLILDIFGKNGYKFAEDKMGEKTWFVYALKNIDFDVTVENVPPFQSMIFPINGDADKMQIGIIICTDKNVKNKKITIQAKEFTPVENSDIMDSVFSGKTWSAETFADYRTDEIVYEKNINLFSEDEYGNTAYVNADRIEISAISACITGEISENFYNAFWNYENAFAVTDSGEKIRIINCAKEGAAGKISRITILNFAEPVNPEEISYIDINGNIINLK